jgi:hypothetical protein
MVVILFFLALSISEPSIYTFNNILLKFLRCDRVLTFGNGVRLLKYKRSEQKLSDHRPVSAVFMAEVEVFCHRKLQKALTLTDAEVEGEVIPDLDFEFR